MKSLLQTILVGSLLLCASASAEPLNVVIIDAGHTVTGQRIAQWAATIPQATVSKLDMPQLRRAAAPADGPTDTVVIWISPEPSLFDKAAGERWSSIVHNRHVGLMIVGLEESDADCNWMMDALRARVDAQPGLLLSQHLTGTNWIWTPGKPKDKQAVVLQKTFDLSERPARAWMQVAADNLAVVSVNDIRVGENKEWQRPTSCDVTAALHAGHNTIRIDAYNDDGPAGIVGALEARRADGQTIARIVTDTTWKAQEQIKGDAKPLPWTDAHIVATVTKGPWENKVETSYGSDQYSLQPQAGSPITAGLADALGQCVVLRSLTPGGNAIALLKADDMPVAVAGDRTIVLAIDPEKTTGDKSVLTSDAFAQFVTRSVLWLAQRPVDQAGRVVAVPVVTTQVTRVLDRAAFFPVTMQLSPLPHEGARLAKALPDSMPALRIIIDEMIEHGVTALQCPLPLPEELAKQVEDYAQQRGMGITYYIEHGLEGFKRDKPPEVSLYSAQYRNGVAKRVAERLAPLAKYPNLINVFATQDEPFHQGLKSFGNSDEEKAEFRKRFGRELPADAMSVRNDPQQWLDLINFRSEYFPVGWRELYKQCKQRWPNVSFALNHDSHNTFGGAANQEGVLFVDDVYHWGSDWADLLTFDIYPYLMKDFRYGLNRTLMVPRMSETHYTFAHMRNLVRSGNKSLGFYIGTYNPEWFDLTPAGAKLFWQSREMAYTAVAGGSDFLIGGIDVPIDARHWDDLGEGLRTLQKASPALLKTKPVIAKAAMLFPRTQCIQTQEEYFNVGQSFETFQRAFGELDLIHEEQVARDGLGDRKILVLFDVKLLPAVVVKKIEAFVEAGGIVIADCVPNEDELRRPSDAMAKLFGVKDAKTARILWPVKMKREIETDAVAVTMPAATQPSDRISGRAFSKAFEFPLVSPRPCTIDGGKALLQTESHALGLVIHRVGKGRMYLLGFCLQDTSFEAWRTNDTKTIAQLNDLLAAMTTDAGVTPHVRSSNPDVEAALRVGANDAFLLIIAHESKEPATQIAFNNNVGFKVANIIDVATGERVAADVIDDMTMLKLDAPTGTTRLLHLTP